MWVQEHNQTHIISAHTIISFQIKESNSRVIRWSDGSLSLRLGKELFDIAQSIDTSATVPRQIIGGLSQSQSQSQQLSQSQNAASGPPPTPGKSQGLTYLVAQHKRSQVLQSEAVITGYMSLRPTGMQSETHRMLVRAVEQKHKQVARLRMAPEPTIDPEREKIELMKQSAKKSKKKVDDMDGFGGGRKRRNYRRAADPEVMWSDDEERGPYAAGSEDDDDDLGMGNSPRKPKRKSGQEKPEEEYQADDFVVPDDSDDEGDGSGRSRKRAREASEVEDDLERMEADLEKRAASDKKNRTPESKKAKKKAVDGDETGEDGAGAMDVESEEEEEDEEFKVRRVTSKRAIAFDDDEE
jgi:RNA polymerase-associated protein LEO1